MSGKPEALWKNPWVQVGLLLLLLVAYILTRQVWIGILIAIVIFGMVVWEIRDGAKHHGWKHELIDTLKALAVAVILWFAAGFLLNTSAPLSAVASCSMLPHLERGDFVVVQGTPPDVPTVKISATDYDALLGTSIVHHPGGDEELAGTLPAYCMTFDNALCRAFREQPATFVEQKGPFTFYYTQCRIEQTGRDVPCIASMEYKDVRYPVHRGNDILVYSPRPSDYFSRIGDIVHRLYLRVDVDGRIYYLTKGDNNPLLDAQIFDYVSGQRNLPVAEEQAKGKVLARIPWLGYFKLFISGLFQEDPQCQQQLVYPGISSEFLPDGG